MYSDSTYTSQLGQGSSEYDDHSKGLSAEWSNKIFPRHSIGASIFFKSDYHKERSISIDKKGKVTTEPWRVDSDFQASIGVQDAITITSKLRATLGFSADHISAMQANDINKTTNTIVPFSCDSTGSTGCVPAEGLVLQSIGIGFLFRCGIGNRVFFICHEESFPYYEGSLFL